jgi:hypothetical protein
MKPSRKYSKPILFGTLIVSTLALVAWSPPTGEDILMSTGTPIAGVACASTPRPACTTTMAVTISTRRAVALAPVVKPRSSI